MASTTISYSPPSSSPVASAKVRLSEPEPNTWSSSPKGASPTLLRRLRVSRYVPSAGLVERRNFEGGHSVFETSRDSHHDHMVCTEMGRVFEFHDPEIERLQREIAEKHGYELVNHNLVLYVKPKDSPIRKSKKG